MVHSEKHRFTVCFTPLLVFINPLTESAVSIFYKLEDFILVVKREYQDPIIVIPYCDVIPVRDPLRYPSGFHIGHCCRFCFRFLFSVDFTEMLSAAVILIHFRSQRKIKILGKCDHISMSPTAFPQTLKLACTEVNGKGPPVLSILSPKAIWASVKL